MQHPLTESRSGHRYRDRYLQQQQPLASKILISWSVVAWTRCLFCIFFARGLAESCVFVWNGGGRRKQLKQTEPAAEEIVEEDHTVGNRLEPRSLKIFFEVRGEEQRVRGTVQFGGVIFGHEKRNEIEGKFVCFNENVVLRQMQRTPVN